MLTLAVVLGVWLMLWGIGQMVIAFRLRSASRALGAGTAASKVGA